jgi:hypothetical protein
MRTEHAFSSESSPRKTCGAGAEKRKEVIDEPNHSRLPRLGRTSRWFGAATLTESNLMSKSIN